MNVILPCLPAVQQAEFLLYEVLDILQKQRTYLNYGGARTVKVEKVCEIYKKYYEIIESLPNLPSLWFHKTSYEEQDRQEILKTIRYILLRKMEQSEENFIQDLALIKKKLSFFTKDSVYFIELLAIEVQINDENVKLPHPSLQHEKSLPALVGKYADYLKEYLVKELDGFQQVGDAYKANKFLLKNDIGVALDVLNKNKSWRKRATTSMVLRGGAGLLMLHTKGGWSWFDRLHTKDQIFITFLAFILPAPIFKLALKVITIALEEGWAGTPSILTALFWGTLLTSFLTLAVYMGYYAVWYITQDVIKDFGREDATIIQEQEYKLLQGLQIKEYCEAVQARKNEQKQAITNIEIAFETLQLHTQASLGMYYRNYKTSAVSFTMYVGAFRKMLEYIYEASPQILPTEPFGNWSYEVKYSIWKAVQGIWILRLEKAFDYFLALSRVTLDRGIDINLYLDVLNLDLKVQGDVNCLESYKAQIEKVQQSIQASLNALPTSYANATIQDWVTQQKNALEARNFEQDIKQIEQQLKLVGQMKAQKNQIVVPLILENEEGILYI